MKELTTVEVGKRLGRSDSAVRRWVRLGMIPARLVGGSYVIRADELRGFKPPARGRQPKGTA